MQVFINKNKNWLTLISGILIVIGLVAHHGFKNELLGIVTLTVAGIIGLVPVTIQAVQALRVKVVSIEFLVTIAVVGAFLIRNFEEAAIVLPAQPPASGSRP